MKTILVVEDEDRMRRMLTLILRRKEYHVIKADSAIEAHRVLKEFPAIDLILLDINMPDVQGDVLNQVQQAFHYKKRVIVCSVLPVEEQRDRVPDAVDYYDKSESFSVLINKIETVFRNEKTSKKILIIDDEPKIRMMYRQLFLDAGYFPIDSGDRPETFAFLKKNIADIDLILLDIAMPKITGLEFYEMIKNKNPKTKIIISSVFSENQQKYLIYRADDYFDKSDSHKVLLKKVEALLNSY